MIKPELPSKSSKGGTYKKVINTAKSLVENGYDHVYCLIDFDIILSENKIIEFIQDSKAINNKEITIYINNPCFETWILLHFEKTGKGFNDCEAVSKDIIKHLNGYNKTQKYFRKINLYKALRPYLETDAIQVYKLLDKLIVKTKK